MDKYEYRRVRLLHLVTAMGYGGRASVAKKIGKSPDYISRMLYPPGKSGSKRIGEDTADLISAAFPTWLDTCPGEKTAPEKVVDEKPPRWPFLTITPDEWGRIQPTIRQALEQQIKAVIPAASHEKRAA